MKYSVRFQPEYQTGRDFEGKNAKRDAYAWAEKMTKELHANMGDKKAKATITKVPQTQPLPRG